MKRFEYIAIGPGGEQVAGSAQAIGELELDSELSDRGLTLTRATELKRKRSVASKRIPTGDLLHFIHQLSFLVEAGVPLVQGLNSIAKRMPESAVQALIEDMSLRIQGGATLSGAMEAHSRSFPTLVRASVRAGEVSGSLDSVLLRVAKHLEWTARVRATTIQALVYPAILVCAILGLIAILLWFLLPRILQILPEGTTDLPLPTTIVKGISDWGVANGFFLVGALVVTVAGFIVSRRTVRGRFFFDTLLLKIPGVGDLVARIATTKYAATTSVLRRAGCDAFVTLELAAKTADNAALEKTYQHAAEGVRGGALLSEALERESGMDPLLLQMVSVGEQSGDLPGALDKLVDYYDEEVPRTVKRFLSILEPLILLSAGAIVAFVLLAAMLPIFQLYGSV